MNYKSVTISSIFLSNSLRASIEIVQTLDSKKSLLYDKHSKGAGGDISIGADLISEEVFYNYLGEFYNLDSEESGYMPALCQTNLVVIIDPLDGSDNFASNIPYFGASLALCKDKEVLEALVINFVSKQVVYLSKEMANNASRPIIFNLDSIQTFSPLNIKCNIMHQIGEKSGIYEKAYNHLAITKHFINNKIKFRNLGALALSLGFSSLYSFVFFVGNIRKYDGIAGLFLSQNSLIYGSTEQYKKDFNIDNLFTKHYELDKIFNETIESNWILIANDKSIIKKILGEKYGIC